MGDAERETSAGRHRRNRRRELLAVLGLACLIVAFMAPVLTPDRVLMTFDARVWEPWSVSVGPNETFRDGSFNADCARFVLPRAHLLREALAGGELPLWSPHIFAGTPFLALWQTGVLYPPNLLLTGFEARHSLGLLVAMHLVIAACGAFALARGQGLGRGAGLLAGIAFAAGGHVALRMGHPSFITTIAWFPWCALAVERWLKAGRRRWLLAVALFWSLLLLAGQATLATISGYLLAALILALALVQRPGWRRPTLAVLALASGTLLAAPQLLPTLEMSASSSRSERSLGDLQRKALHPAQAAQWLVPEIYGDVLERSYETPAAALGSHRGHTSYAASVAGYVGCLVPSLALLGLICGPGWGGRRLFWCGVLLAAWALAFATPLFTAAHTVLPGFRFSTISRAAVFHTVSIVVLAARGAHLLAVGALSRRARILAGCVPPLAGLGAVVLATTLTGCALPGSFQLFRLGIATLGGAAIIVAAPWLAPRRLLWPLMLLIVCGELGSFALPHRAARPTEEVFPETPSLRWLAQQSDLGRVARFDPQPAAPHDAGLARANTLSLFGLREPGGFAPMHRDDLDAYLSAAGWTSRSPWAVRAVGDLATFSSPLFAHFGVTHVLAPRDADLAPLTLLHRGDLSIWRAPDPLPEAYVAAQTRVVGDLRQAIQMMADPAHEPLRVALIPSGGSGAAPVDSAAPTAEADIVERGFNEIVVRTPDHSIGGWLVLAEAWAPGWEHRVDGTERGPTTRTNGIFHGVPIEEGAHEVVLRYRPASFRRGIAVAFGGLLVLIAAALVWRQRPAPP